jgi:hypothetical protein
MFGPITVVDKATTRSLLIGSQIQGEVWLDPKVAPVEDGPGPVFYSPYVAGWLMSGVTNPDGSGLMVGLGAGVGIVTLLHNFPSMDLTCVEIDPMVVELANRWFPLLSHYQDQGRLTIVTQDITRYLIQAITEEDHWDFGLLDAYTGDNEPHAPTELLTMSSEVCGELWINAIDHANGPVVRHIRETLETMEKPVKFSGAANQPAFLGITNRLLGTKLPSPKELDGFTPYKGLGGPGVGAARAHYRFIADQAS